MTTHNCDDEETVDFDYFPDEVVDIEPIPLCWTFTIIALLVMNIIIYSAMIVVAMLK